MSDGIEHFIVVQVMVVLKGSDKDVLVLVLLQVLLWKKTLLGSDTHSISSCLDNKSDQKLSPFDCHLISPSIFPKDSSDFVSCYKYGCLPSL